MLWLLILQAVVGSVFWPAAYPPGTVVDGTVPSLPSPVFRWGPVPSTSLVCDRPAAPALPSPIVVTVARATLTLAWDDPDHPGRTCEAPPLPVLPGMFPKCFSAPCPEYPIGVGVFALTPLPRVSVEPVPWTSPPECLPPFGAQAVSIFPTGYTRRANGQPGSRTVANFQLASPNSPIVLVALRIDGVLLYPQARGEELTGLPGWEFVMPASGTHSLTIQANSAYGCTREVLAAPLVVP